MTYLITSIDRGSLPSSGRGNWDRNGITRISPAVPEPSLPLPFAPFLRFIGADFFVPPAVGGPCWILTQILKHLTVTTCISVTLQHHYQFRGAFTFDSSSRHYKILKAKLENGSNFSSIENLQEKL